MASQKLNTRGRTVIHFSFLYNSSLTIICVTAVIEHSEQDTSSSRGFTVIARSRAECDHPQVQKQCTEKCNGQSKLDIPAMK